MKEISALLEVKKALREILQSDIDAMISAGVEVLRVPMKLVYTIIKAITARRKCRIVLCGNALPTSHETALEKRVATYAGGIDIGLLRFLLADAAKDQLQLATWDISTAFLNAPVQPRDLKAAHSGKKQVTVGVPPRALVRLGLVPPNTYWLVQLAMYGLDTSPRDWGMHRTDVLSKLRLDVPSGILSLRKSLVNSSVWYIMAQKSAEAESIYQGWVAIYVDDFLGGSHGDLVDRIYEFVNATWECGELERVVTAEAGKAVRFDGLELQWSNDRTKLFVHQASYATDLVSRYEGQFTNTGCSLDQAASGYRA